MSLDDEVTSGGVIAPRFLDEIADEVDVIEDKKAPPFRKDYLKLGRLICRQMELNLY